MLYVFELPNTPKLNKGEQMSPKFFRKITTTKRQKGKHVLL